MLYAKQQVANIKKQLAQSSAQNLTNLTNQHNWNLFDRRQYLPAALPGWKNLSDKGWAWRILHLNHLNMLQLIYQEYESGLIKNNKIDSWVLMARSWFRVLWSDSVEPEIKEGRDILRQLLRPEEGYPKKYRDWLVDKQIVNPDLISDYNSNNKTRGEA
jgi:hypothetical protein